MSLTRYKTLLLTGDPYVLVEREGDQLRRIILVDKGVSITPEGDVEFIDEREQAELLNYYLARLSQNATYASALRVDKNDFEAIIEALSRLGVEPPIAFAQLVREKNLMGTYKPHLTIVDKLSSVAPKERATLENLLKLVTSTAQYNKLLSSVALLYNPKYHHFYPSQYELIRDLFEFCKNHGLMLFVGFIDPKKQWSRSTGPLFVTGYVKYVGPVDNRFFDMMRQENQPPRMFEYYSKFRKKVPRVAYTYNEGDKLKLTEMVQAVKDTLHSTTHPECPIELPAELKTPVNCRLLSRGLNRVIVYTVKYEDKWIHELEATLNNLGFRTRPPLTWPY